MNIADVPYDGIGSNFAIWVPFQAESQVEHHFLSTKEIVWEMITSLDTYNVWFDGIQRAIPDLKTKETFNKNYLIKLLSCNNGQKIRTMRLVAAKMPNPA